MKTNMNFHSWLILLGLTLSVAAPAQAQITFRGAGTTASGACCNQTPGLPAGWQPNDIHLLIVETKDNVVSTAPAGWTLLNAANSGTTHRASLWWRRAVAGDTAPLVTHASGGQIIAKIIGFSGVDTTTAFDVANSFTVSAADLTTEAGAITTVTPNTMLVYIAMMASAHTALGTPAGSTPWTQAFFDWTNSATGASIGAYYGLRAAAGAKAAVTGTRTGGANAVSHGVQLALRPAPAPAQITLRGVGTTASGACCNLTPGLPAGWQPNDIHLLIVETKDNVVSTAPAGWTLLNAANSGTTHRASLWWRRAAAGDAAPLVTHAAGSQIIAKVIGFSGVNTTTAFDVANSFTVSAADLTTEAGAITTVTPNTMLVYIAMMASAHTALGTPAGSAPWTQAFFDWTNSATGASIGAYYGLRAAAGAQAAVTGTRTGGANAVSHGVQLALRPAGGAPDTAPPSVPTGVTPTVVSATQINLTWTASTDNVGVTGYQVDRCQGAGCANFAQVATPAGTSLSDTGLTASTSYSYRVRAVDGAGNASGNSSVASATTLAAAQAQLFFIHTDHLNTPRVITNNTAQVVWRWDHTEPFGSIPPNENPSGLGTFTCNLRLPGQYFDKESNTHYNMMRDYDPAIGRYLQSDPIGLRGGINTYAYGEGNPLSKFDPLGLAVWICNRAVQGFPGVGNHAYLWNDKTQQACSMRGSSGWGLPSNKEKGPGPGGDQCVEVPGSAGKEAQIMNCCAKDANNGMWFPVVNDCHTANQDCLTRAGLKSPAVPGGRLGPCDSCEPRPTGSTFHGAP